MIGLFGSLMNSVPSAILGSAAGSTLNPGMAISPMQPSIGAGGNFIDNQLMDQYTQPMPVEPSKPFDTSKLTDYSSMAMSGLTPPPLPNPQNEITSLMNMAMKRDERDDPFLQTPQGKLMQYLSLMSAR